MEMILAGNPQFGIQFIGVFPQLKLQFGFVFIGIVVHAAYLLLGIYCLSFFYIQISSLKQLLSRIWAI